MVKALCGQVSQEAERALKTRVGTASIGLPTSQTPPPESVSFRDGALKTENLSLEGSLWIQAIGWGCRSGGSMFLACTGSQGQVLCVTLRVGTLTIQHELTFL